MMANANNIIIIIHKKENGYSVLVSVCLMYLFIFCVYFSTKAQIVS